MTNLTHTQPMTNPTTPQHVSPDDHRNVYDDLQELLPATGKGEIAPFQTYGASEMLAEMLAESAPVVALAMQRRQVTLANPQVMVDCAHAGMLPRRFASFLGFSLPALEKWCEANNLLDYFHMAHSAFASECEAQLLDLDSQQFDLDSEKDLYIATIDACEQVTEEIKDENSDIADRGMALQIVAAKAELAEKRLKVMSLAATSKNQQLKLKSNILQYAASINDPQRYNRTGIKGQVQEGSGAIINITLPPVDPSIRPTSSRTIDQSPVDTNPILNVGKGVQ